MNDIKKKINLYTSFDKVVNVGIADIKYASAPYHLRTNLGSCVALTLYDKVKKTGGLVHVMLPKSFRNETKIGKCADTAVPEIIKTMIKKQGSDKKNLSAKIFGGAKMLANTSNDIGQKNVNEVIRLVKKEGMRIEKRKTGGIKGYVVQLDTSTGIVMCRVFGEEIEYF
jgi:chemotaxis protein CheD